VSETFGPLERIVGGELGSRFSAAVVRVEQHGRLRFERAFGTLHGGGGGACAADTRFDLASITKVFVATVALADIARGAVSLDLPLLGLVPEWRGTAHAPITLRQLLAHDAGLRSGADYRTLLDRDVEAFALTEPLAAAPGERVIYSDLGFIALGVVLARLHGRSLAALVRERLRALGAASTAYAPRGVERAVTPATETDLWRGGVQGSVHDEKAHLLGGVAGHAGLFGTARDVALLGEWYLAALHGRATPVDAELAREAVREQAYDPVLRRGLGWALKTTDDNSCGPLMAPSSFGHTGFTGTSIWVDPLRDASIVLLTNAVHYGRSDIRAIRTAVAGAALEALAIAC